MSPRFFTLTSLRRRGWRDRAIDSLLGQPDRLRTRGSRSARLYSRARVLAVEATDQFASSGRRDQRRAAAGYKAAQARRARLLATIDAAQIVVPQLDDTALAKLADGAGQRPMQPARRSRRRRRPSPTETRWRGRESTPESRIVDALMTRACGSLERVIRGTPGATVARRLLLWKALRAIDDAYPALLARVVRVQNGTLEEVLAEPPADPLPAVVFCGQPVRVDRIGGLIVELRESVWLGCECKILALWDSDSIKWKIVPTRFGDDGPEEMAVYHRNRFGWLGFHPQRVWGPPADLLRLLQAIASHEARESAKASRRRRSVENPRRRMKGLQ